MAAFQPSPADADGAGSRLGGFSQLSVSSEAVQPGGMGPSRRTLRRREYRQQQLRQSGASPSPETPSPSPVGGAPPAAPGHLRAGVSGSEPALSTAITHQPSAVAPPASSREAATQTDLTGDIAAAALELMQLRASAARLEAGLGALHHARSDALATGPHVFGAAVAELGRQAESGC